MQKINITEWKLQESTVQDKLCTIGGHDIGEMSFWSNALSRWVVLKQVRDKNRPIDHPILELDIMEFERIKTLVDSGFSTREALERIGL